MNFTVRFECGENERFIEGCFDKSLGKKAPVSYRGNQYWATILSAEIIEDGKAANITFET